MLSKIMIHVHSSATLKQISGQKRKTKNQKPIRNRLEKIIYIDTCELWDTETKTAIGPENAIAL